MPPRLLGAGLWLVLTVSGGAWIQDLPNATDAHGAFGLPDQRGSRLLLIPNVARPELLKAALCSGGRRVVVQFERRQVEAANDGRQSPRNFDKLAGNAFTVLRDKVDPDTPCFVATETLLAGSTVLKVAGSQGTDPCRQRDRLAALRSRPAINCWPVARLGPERHVVLLEFERRGKDALASIVLIDGTRTVFADIPSEFKGAGQDLWRVDDGGVLSPDGLKIVCALQRGGSFVLGTAWAGAEGMLLSLWTSDGDRFAKVINDYWYQAPR